MGRGLYLHPGLDPKVEELPLPRMPGTHAIDEIPVRTREDVEPPVPRIHLNTWIVDPPAPDAELLEEGPDLTKVTSVLLH